MLPYDTPSPQDLDKLMRGDFVSAPRSKNAKIPKALNDIVMKAMSPDIHSRYQHATDLLDEVLEVRKIIFVRRTPRPALSGPIVTGAAGIEAPDDIQNRVRAREVAQAPRFCWHCRKPLHARADRCPFCGEGQ
jgi:hypothetical protein